MGSNGLPPLVKKMPIPTSPPAPVKKDTADKIEQRKDKQFDPHSALVSLAMLGMALDASIGGDE